MKSTHDIVSVGIDIGTTTTQVILSEFSLAEIARAGQIPRVDITNRKLIYESDIVFTPLVDAETIDAVRLAGILKQEYLQAGISPDQVETGAVIITGETARKKNADQILKAIADLAGDFVVMVAGPNVESMIAGRGSGAASYSRQHFTTVSNIDIGGGSANSAVFRQGNLVGSAAMNFGGRVIEMKDGVVTAITRAGAWIISEAGVQIRVGMRPTLAELTRVTDCMADVTVHLMEGTTSPLAEKLYQTPPNPVSCAGKPVMFSGGIGYYFYSPMVLNSVADVSIHGDIGPLLAQSLRFQPKIKSYNLIKPAETQRATVLGASSQTLTLSGSTIWAEQSILPLKNVPVIRPDLFGKELSPDMISETVRNALLRWDLDLGVDPFAISLELDFRMDYPQLVQVAQGLEVFAASLPKGRPLIAIIKRDYAQVLGQTVKGLVKERPLLVIDQVGLDEGDYIDIGTPLMDGKVVPLVVKTLIFYH